MFCLLLPPAGGDELQGIKRGIVEQSDLIVVTKCDGDLVPAARRVAYEYMSALKYMRPLTKLWRPKVKMCSAVTGEGIEEVWSIMKNFREIMEDSGEMEKRRSEQQQKWMWSYVEEKLLRMVREVRGQEVQNLEERVRRDSLSPGSAADKVVEMFLEKCRKG